MKTHKFARKPFYVDAVRVSATNMEEVAEWCQGEVLTDDDQESPTFGQKYVKVKVHRPLTDDQTKAFIGKWVLFAGTGFKVYNPKAFDKSFEKVKTLTKAQADEAGIKVPHEPKHKGSIKHSDGPKKSQRKRPRPQPPKNPVLTPEAAAKINGGRDEATKADETQVAQEVKAEVKENAVANEVAAAGGQLETAPKTPDQEIEEMLAEASTPDRG